jgi:2-iminobutanoate/2-iminopropanoate deaminase
MASKVISTDKAPKAIGPYSQAKEANGLVLVSGQLPIDPETGKMPESIEEQTDQSMKNVITIVKAAGGTEKNILRCGLYIRDMGSFADINEVYAKYFEEDPPARAVVEVSALPKGAMIEVEAVAII